MPVHAMQNPLQQYEHLGEPALFPSSLMMPDTAMAMAMAVGLEMEMEMEMGMGIEMEMGMGMEMGMKMGMEMEMMLYVSIFERYSDVIKYQQLHTYKF